MERYMKMCNPFELCTKQCKTENITIPNFDKFKYAIDYVEDLKLIPFCGDKVLKLNYALEINYLDENILKQKFVKKDSFLFINFGIEPEKTRAKVRSALCLCENNIIVKTRAEVYEI